MMTALIIVMETKIQVGDVCILAILEVLIFHLNLHHQSASSHDYARPGAAIVRICTKLQTENHQTQVVWASH